MRVSCSLFDDNRHAPVVPWTQILLLILTTVLFCMLLASVNLSMGIVAHEFAAALRSRR